MQNLTKQINTTIWLLTFGLFYINAYLIFLPGLYFLKKSKGDIEIINHASLAFNWSILVILLKLLLTLLISLSLDTIGSIQLKLMDINAIFSCSYALLALSGKFINIDLIPKFSNFLKNNKQKNV